MRSRGSQEALRRKMKKNEENRQHTAVTTAAATLKIAANQSAATARVRWPKLLSAAVEACRSAAKNVRLCPPSPKM